MTKKGGGSRHGEVELFERPEELCAWAAAHVPEYGVTEEEAGLLLGYMEGHAYAVGTDKAGCLYRTDINEEGGETEEYSIDEMILTVSEWICEMLCDADEKRHFPEDLIDFAHEQDRYEQLKKDDAQLDRLYAVTAVGKRTKALAQQAALDIIRRLKEGVDLEAVAALAAEMIRAECDWEEHRGECEWEESRKGR